MMERPGRLKTRIKAMPSSTPGMRKGSQRRELRKLHELHELNRLNRLNEAAASLDLAGSRNSRGRKARATIAKADMIESQAEFRMADWPAARAPGNSIQVRLTVRRWTIGMADAREIMRRVAMPLATNHARPS